MDMIDASYDIDLQMDEYVAQRDGGYSWKKHKALASGLMHIASLPNMSINSPFLGGLSSTSNSA